MWNYYGRKSSFIDYYPSPKYDLIIEPFAGTAPYSFKYWYKNIILVEKYDVIVKIWKWLQQCSRDDILKLPRLKEGENIDDFNWDCDEAKWLIGFNITYGPSMPKKTASKWKTTHRPKFQDYKINFIAENLYKIKEWKIIEGSYEDIENKQATWFIDPPYQYGGEYYKFNNIDYSFLAKWCKNRKGDMIVCENNKADWLNFKYLKEVNGISNKSETEVIYTNIKSPHIYFF